MEDKDNFWNFIGSVALGIIGGKIILELLEKRCKFCGEKYNKNEKKCPFCGRGDF